MICVNARVSTLENFAHFFSGECSHSYNSVWLDWSLTASTQWW